MSKILYTHVNILLNERDKEILINPINERFYNEHSDMGRDYEKLLCKHPKELIKRVRYFGKI